MTDNDQPLFDIIFRGDILPGHQLPQVKAQLAKLFKTDTAKVNGLFSGAAVPLKRNVDQALATKYVAALRQAGADVQLAAAGSVRTSTTQRARPERPAVSEPSASVSEPNPVVAEPKMSLQQRLAQQEQQREAAAAEKLRQEQQAQEQALQSGAFSLAPLGADLLEASDKTPLAEVVVDVSHFSLRPQEGRLVDASEQASSDPVTVQIEDFGLSDVGEDLLTEAEKSRPPAIGVEAPAVDLAPVGSDMGQIKPATPPPPPDTSKLSIAED